MAIMYKDKTFCFSDCINTECHRHPSAIDMEDLGRWVAALGLPEGGTPIAFADLTEACETYVPPAVKGGG